MVDYLAEFRTRAARLEKLRREPEKIPHLKAYYKDHIADFINDWGMTFDPRNPEIKLPSNVPFLLFGKQREWVEWLIQRWKNREDGLTEKSRDMGVSWLSVAVAMSIWLFYPGIVIGFGSRKEEYVDKLGDPKSLFWKARFFIDNVPKELRPAGYKSREHAPYMRIINPENGSSVVGESGANIGRGARTSIYFKDESAFYEQPELIDAALSQTSNCKIDISTPNGEGNPFHRKRINGKIPVFTFHWRDDPRKGEEWYRKQKETLDPVVLAQEVDIDYSASKNNVFIPGELVERSQSHDVSLITPMGPKILSVDPARYGDDRTVITLRQGRVVFWQRVWNHMNTQDVAGIVKQIDYETYDIEQIAIDVIGVGAGVVDTCKATMPEPRRIVSVNASIRQADGRNYNLRAKMYANLLEWLKDEPVVLPNDKELKAELSGIEYEYRNGELLLRDKEELKKKLGRSPDKADSLAIGFACPVKYAGKQHLPMFAISD